MSEPTPNAARSSTAVDRLAILLALIGVLFGGYVVYSRLPDEGVALIVARALDEPVVLPEYLHARNVEFETDYYGHRYKGNTRDLVDSHVLYYGAWEKWILFFLKDAAASLDRSDLVFVDVGANTGLHSVFMSSHVETVHAVEPYPPAIQRIADQVELNALTNVVIHPVGLGAEDATLPFYEPPGWNGMTGSFVQSMHEENQGAGLELQIVRGDDYFPSHSIESFDLIKIDIEGYEPFALEGLREQMARCRPVVVMELSIDPESDTLFSSIRALRAALPENYVFFRFASYSRYSGSYQIEPLDVDFGVKAQYDIIAAPAETADRLPRSADYSREYRQLMDGIPPTV